MEEDIDYQSFLKIDKNQLDDAIEEQPDLFYRISVGVAFAISTMDKAKKDLSTCDAKLAFSIRLKRENLGEKVTEAIMLSLIESEDKHKEAVKEYLQAKFRADELLALKEAFLQRSYMLRELVSLYVAEYYSTGSVSPDRKDMKRFTYGRDRKKLKRARSGRES